MSKLFKLICPVSFAAVMFFSCSDDPPVTPQNNDNVKDNILLVDTSEHLVTEVLTFFGSTGWDWGTAVEITPEGDFIITGSTDSYGEGKNTLYLVKAKPNGERIWEKYLGGSGEDNGEAIVIAPDGGYVVAGVTGSFNGNYDIYLVKVNSSGETVWEKSLGSTDFEWGTAMVKLTDGYAVCGYSLANDGGDFYLVRTDLNGDLLWSKTFIATDREWPFALTATPDGGFIMAGFKHYDGTNDIDAYLVKTDDTGKVIWQEVYGDASDQYVYDIVETNGSFIVLGSSRSSGNNAELPYLFKINDVGVVLWEAVYGTYGNFNGRDLLVNPDGSIVFTGLINFNGTISGTGVVKTNSSGLFLWSDVIGLAGTGMSIIRNDDGAYTITGFASDNINIGETDMLLMKVKER